MHAIGADRPRPKESMIFATHSTHKLLAGISQASQILVRESETQKLDRNIFNEAYLMHTSTSPQYAIIASCDVAAAMMEPPGGTALVEESIMEAIELPPRDAQGRRRMGRGLVVQGLGPGQSGRGRDRRAGRLDAAEPTRTGTASATSPPGFNMLDPIKATLITPGLNVSGEFAETGIPASIVTRYLVEHGVIVEKTGLYSFFIMFTIGITKGRWNTLRECPAAVQGRLRQEPADVADPARVLQAVPALRRDRPARICPSRFTTPTRSTMSPA